MPCVTARSTSTRDAQHAILHHGAVVPSGALLRNRLSREADEAGLADAAVVRGNAKKGRPEMKDDSQPCETSAWCKCLSAG